MESAIFMRGPRKIEMVSFACLSREHAYSVKAVRLAISTYLRTDYSQPSIAFTVFRRRVHS